MSKKIALSLALSSSLLSSGLFAATTESQPIKQHYFNPQDSGVVLSISGGLVQTQASYSGANFFGGSFDHTFPTKNGGAGEIDLGYRFAFGQKDKWNQFYVGGAAVFGIYGNMIKNIAIIAPSLPAYDQGSTTRYGGKIFIGKYWKSPFYTELAYGIGGTSDASMYADLSLRAGFDVTDNLSVFGQLTAGGQANVFSSVFSAMFLTLSGTGTTYTSEQIGLQYKF